jgi:hypothetical protein
VFTQALGTTTTGFEGEFRFLADVQGLGTAAGRHPSADLLLIFNSSYQSLRELVTGYGYTQFCTRGTTTSLPTSAVETGETYATITTSTGLEVVKMLDVKTGAGDWRLLPEVPLLQLRDYATRTPGPPMAWSWLDSGSVSGSTYTAGKIAVTPVPNGGSYVLWTMNRITPPASATDHYLYHVESWRQWHLFDAMSKIVGARDKDTAKKLDYVLSRLNPEVEGSPAYLIKKFAPTKSGPKTWTRASNYRGTGWGR